MDFCVPFWNLGGGFETRFVTAVATFSLCYVNIFRMAAVKLKNKKHKAKALVVFAHPDDESLFFANLVLAKSHRNWEFLCATTGGAEGREAERWKELSEAARRLGVKKVSSLGLADNYPHRLDVNVIEKRLREDFSHYNEVFTHGALGEYGHFHHQDLCYAVHKAYLKSSTKVYSVAYNALADLSIPYDSKRFKKKLQILVDIYGKETKRFINLLEATQSEHYCKLSWAEAQALYLFLSGATKNLDVRKVLRHQSIVPFLLDGSYQSSTQNFFKLYFGG